MKNTLLLIALIGLLAAGSGCRMCADPYDYCGPTYAGPCGPVVCNPNARAGSVLSPSPYVGAGPEVMADGQLQTDGEPTLAPIPVKEESVGPPPRLDVIENNTRTLPAPPRKARRSGTRYR
jgi:hypothetical protein